MPGADEWVFQCEFVIAQGECTVANNKHIVLKETEQKNQPILEISRQSLEGIVIQRLDRQDATHNALSDFWLQVVNGLVINWLDKTFFLWFSCR